MMNSNRSATRPTTFADTRRVEVVGPSVHTPGTRAKPAPPTAPAR